MPKATVTMGQVWEAFDRSALRYVASLPTALQNALGEAWQIAGAPIERLTVPPFYKVLVPHVILADPNGLRMTMVWGSEAAGLLPTVLPTGLPA